MFFLWKYRQAKCLGLQPATINPEIDVGFAIRVLAFGVYVVIGATLGILTSIPGHTNLSLIPDIFVATVPVVSALIFGSQPDVLKVLCQPGHIVWQYVFFTRRTRLHTESAAAA